MTLNLNQNTACYIMVPVLAFCIVVQYNDPDGWLWMAIYGVGLILTLLHLFSKSSTVALSTASFVGFAGFVYISISVGELEADKVLSSMNMEGRGVDRGTRSIRIVDPVRVAGAPRLGHACKPPSPSLTSSRRRT